MDIREIPVPGYERVVVGDDHSCSYRGLIAIHRTVDGRAIGGTRLWRYVSDADALDDVLRLARGMTYKAAAAELPLGGGKSVIQLPAGTYEREALLLAHGRFVDALGGRYVAAEDVGTTPADMDVMRRVTEHVAGLPDTGGDPAPHTARGVFRATQAAAFACWGSSDLGGRRVALQGCGNVGLHLARQLARAGATLVVSDIEPERAQRLQAELGAEVVDADAIYDQHVDVFAPCALGGVLNETTIRRLRARIVVGAANNQLLEPGDGVLLDARGILYIPDLIANAGGVINGCRELLGWDIERTTAEIEAIYDRVLQVIELAAQESVPMASAADGYAEQRLSAARAADYNQLQRTSRQASATADPIRVLLQGGGL